jgi:hypothetical protein
MVTHQELDARSLAMHTHAVQLMREDPARLDRAREIINRWLIDVDPGVRDYFEEWKKLIDAGVDAVAAVATADNERATALRQASPVSCTLTPRERSNFLRSWKESHPPASQLKPKAPEP